MEIEIVHRPSYSLAVAKLTPSERIRAEAGAMVSMSGEGLVVELTGPGMIYMQTRSPQALINWIIPQLPKPEIKSS